jgi:hypothetical protein
MVMVMETTSWAAHWICGQEWSCLQPLQADCHACIGEGLCKLSSLGASYTSLLMAASCMAIGRGTTAAPPARPLACDESASCRCRGPAPEGPGGIAAAFSRLGWAVRLLAWCSLIIHVTISMAPAVRID